MKHRNGMTFVSLITVIVTIFTVAACSPNATASRSSGNPTPTPIPLAAAPIKPTYTVQRGDVTSLIQFDGRITPVKLSDLFFRTDGRVKNVYVKQGDLVKTGQLLADLEVIDSLKRQQSGNDLALRTAQIHLEMAQLDLKQAEALDNTPAQRQFDIPMKQYAVELAQIALDETNLNNEDVQANIAAAQIFAPFDGQVLSVDIYAGSDAAAYKTGVTIGDITQMEVTSEPSSDQLSQLIEGQPITVVASFQPGVVLKGKIRQLPFTSTTSNTADPMTHIQLDTDPTKSGFTYNDAVRVTVTLQQKTGVLWLPIQAIRTFEGRQFVVVQDGAVQRSMDVKVGITGTDRVEITDGLTEGQIVVSP
jgi:RND family efflux transporter MFP subunit